MYAIGQKELSLVNREFLLEKLFITIQIQAKIATNIGRVCNEEL